MARRILRSVGVVLCAMLLATGLSSSALAEAKSADDFVVEARAKITEVTPQEVKAELDAGKPVILLDVRDSEEFAAGHLPKAVNLSRGLLEFKIGKVLPDRNANIVLYCRTDARSALATAVLKEMGYPNVRNMKGAFKAWGEAGYPIYNRHGKFTMVGFEEAE